MKKIVVTFLFSLLLFVDGKTQMIFENHTNEVYNYLARMSQKGLIEFNDVILPISRETITNKLFELQKNNNSLSLIEKKELVFYLKEFTPISFSSTGKEVATFFKKDNNGRFRSFTATGDNFFITADPIIQGAGSIYNKINFTQRAIGIQSWGKIGKHIGFQFSGKDVNESRDDTSREAYIYNGPRTGFVNLVYDPSRKNVNFSEYKANISYSWKNGSVNVGQDYMLWGYGQNGRIVLSDKAPVSPYLRIDYQPLKWIRFNYAHFWLNSKIIDSNITYSFQNNVYGGTRITLVPKFFATHSITLTPLKGVDFSIGESIVYADKLNVAYLIPLMFFKAADNNQSNYNILAGSNGQFFFQLSLKNRPRNTHLYSTVFIDEIRISEIFNGLKSRNQIGYNIGGTLNDFILPYLSIYSEYTKVFPSVYNNINPAQSYTSYGSYLGDWMGNNFDRLLFGAKYTPFARLKLDARFQLSRKGAETTIEQQYVASPQPVFLFKKQFEQRELYINASYEILNNIYLKANLRTINTIYANQLTNSIFTNYSFGVNFGL
ncbi:MAG: capsule assembly Wzi family protein [Sediminibacterium sp.]|nr:capsule assembly Wzi family protein [Sediminibacterium sp.]